MGSSRLRVFSLKTNREWKKGCSQQKIHHLCLFEKQHKKNTNADVVIL